MLYEPPSREEGIAGLISEDPANILNITTSAVIAIITDMFFTWRIAAGFRIRI